MSSEPGFGDVMVAPIRASRLDTEAWGVMDRWVRSLSHFLRVAIALLGRAAS